MDVAVALDCQLDGAELLIREGGALVNARKCLRMPDFSRGVVVGGAVSVGLEELLSVDIVGLLLGGK